MGVLTFPEDAFEKQGGAGGGAGWSREGTTRPDLSRLFSVSDGSQLILVTLSKEDFPCIFLPSL